MSNVLINNKYYNLLGANNCIIIFILQDDQTQQLFFKCIHTKNMHIQR